MHVALVANTAWLDEYLSMFRYLVVGLIDEQVRVTQVLPERLDEGDVSGFCDQVRWRDSRWPSIRRHRLSRLAEPIDRLGVDLIHALDGRLWEGSVRLAKQLGTPLILSASSAMDVPQTDRLKRLNEVDKVAFAATTGPLANGIRNRIGSDMQVEVVPQGVHVPEKARAHNWEDGAICAVVSGNGAYDTEYDALLAALKAIVTRYPQAQFFFDGQGADQHMLWQAGRRYGLLANMSLVPRRLGHRELLLRADVLIHPQALGRSRTLTIGAMANGVPVIALKDPWLDYLIDQETAWVIDRADPAGWVEAIGPLIETPSLSQSLVTRAREWVRRHHIASMQVSLTLGLYKQVTGESIKFPA